MKNLSIPLLLLLVTFSCKNKDINEGEEFRPREVNEDFQKFHFNRIVYDGVEYLITERDNNNPHEGFGFMAFSGSKLIDDQDTLMAHLKSISDMQSRIYARLYGVSDSAGDSLYQSIFNYYLEKEKEESAARLQIITDRAEAEE
ncbi:MAG: hypothetical protein ABJG78_18605 [Cyclobacteriaceae bacterium]